jgi:hypothetical protein
MADDKETDQAIGWTAPDDKPWRRRIGADDAGQAAEAPTKPAEAPADAGRADDASERRRRS